MSSRRLAAVFAHPDDESRIVGGTLAQYALEGARVAVWVATCGEAWKPGADPEEMAQLRQRESAQATRMLGLARIELRRHPDGGLSSLDPTLLVDEIAAFLAEERPQVVITFGPEGRSLHPDHITVHQVATAAFDRTCPPPARLFNTTVPESLARETNWGYPATPDREVAVTMPLSGEALARKRRATIEAHASQYHAPPFSNLDEGARWRALATEYFVLARPVGELLRADDLFAGLR